MLYQTDPLCNYYFTNFKVISTSTLGWYFRSQCCHFFLFECEIEGEWDKEHLSKSLSFWKEWVQNHHYKENPTPVNWCPGEDNPTRNMIFICMKITDNVNFRNNHEYHWWVYELRSDAAFHFCTDLSELCSSPDLELKFTVSQTGNFLYVPNS